MRAIPSRFQCMPQDLLKYMGRHGCDQQLRCIVEMSGRLDLDRLSRAMSLTLDQEPVLDCRFVLDGDRTY